MRAIDVLKQRSKDKIVKERFIKNILNDAGKEIIRQQDRVINRFGVKKIVSEISKRNYAVSGNRLTVTHPIRQRFIDMKNVSGRRQRAIPIHNKIVYREFSSIIGQLAFGFTEDVKNLIANDYNLEL